MDMGKSIRRSSPNGAHRVIINWLYCTVQMLHVHVCLSVSLSISVSRSICDLSPFIANYRQRGCAGCGGRCSLAVYRTRRRQRSRPVWLCVSLSLSVCVCVCGCARLFSVQSDHHQAAGIIRISSQHASCSDVTQSDQDNPFIYRRSSALCSHRQST